MKMNRYSFYFAVLETARLQTKKEQLFTFLRMGTLSHSKRKPNKPLKALASLAGTLTHGLRHFVPNFSPCIIAP
ncbi:hypothetical protein TE101_20685 (plasmid) [Alteromonas macleodii]|nr:hypothetical protein TE101_20685 [Alteromonas macleodii]